MWLLDNQNVDETSREKTQKLLDQGECVFIWPEGVDYKDFNEWCIKEGLDEISIDIIRDNVKCGVIESLEYKTDTAMNTVSECELTGGKDFLDNFDLSL